jgi:hypothetical protein
MKTKSKISAYILRGSAAALLTSCVIVALSSAINLPNHAPKFPVSRNDTAFGVNGHESAASMAAPAIKRKLALTFADRVAYQRAIEDVYWQHRIWPKENAEPKPPLDKGDVASGDRKEGRRLSAPLAGAGGLLAKADHS